MANLEIQPDRWYSLGSIFGKSLVSIDKFRQLLQSQPIAIEAREKPTPEYDLNFMLLASEIMEADFRGGRLTLDMDYYYQREGQYFPLDIPQSEDMDKLREFSGKPMVGSTKFGALGLILRHVRDRDLYGVPTPNPNDNSLIERDYRFRMFLRSHKGVYRDDARAVLAYRDNEVGIIPTSVHFDEWIEENSNTNGTLIVPREAAKIATLEIMLQTKLT